MEVGHAPLIWRSVQEADAAAAVSRVVVSTDSDEIREYVESGFLGGVSVMNQPGASDTSLPEDAERYVLGTLWRLERYRPDVIVRLFCTNPFTEPQDINACLAMIEKGASAVVSVTEPSEWPSQLVRVRRNGTLKHVFKHWRQPRQAWSDHRVINGAVYAAKLDYWEMHGGYFGPGTQYYEMPRERSWDIDTPFDLKVARLLV